MRLLTTMARWARGRRRLITCRRPDIAGLWWGWVERFTIWVAMMVLAMERRWCTRLRPGRVILRALGLMRQLIPLRLGGIGLRRRCIRITFTLLAGRLPVARRARLSIRA